MKKQKVFMTLILTLIMIAAMSSIKFTQAIDEDLTLLKPDGLTINAVNELSWKSVTNATGYKYRVSGGDWIYTANPKADLNSEISQAVKIAVTNNNASAELIAEVKSVATGLADSEAATFTHSFTDYTDVNKLSDFSDYVSIPADGLLVNANPTYSNVIKTNEIMTVAFKAESLPTNGSRAYQFYFLNNGYTYSYIFRFRLDSLAGPWYLQKLVSNDTAASTILSSVTLDNFKDNKYYISFGALNILNFTGETTGERYFLKVWTYGEDGLPVIVLENAHDFTDLESRLAARKNNLEVKDLDAPASMSFKLFSTGNDKLSAPINLYYDNVAERVYWESKTIGSTYKWNINGGAWNYTNKNYAEVASILDNIRNSNDKDVSFKVVSVSSTAGLNDSNANVLNFNAKLNASTSLAQKDLIDCINYNGSLGVKEDVKDKFFPKSNSEWLPEGKHIYQGNGINKNEFLYFSLKYSLDNSETQIYSILYDSAYNDGHNIEILRNETGKGVRVRFKLSGNKDYYSFSGEPLELNIKYTVSMGVFDIFDTDTGEKTAERMVVKITTKTEDGLDKTVLFAERDYTSEFYKSGDKIYLQKFSSNTQYYSYLITDYSKYINDAKPDFVFDNASDCANITLDSLEGCSYQYWFYMPTEVDTNTLGGLWVLKQPFTQDNTVKLQNLSTYVLDGKVQMYVKIKDSENNIRTVYYTYTPEEIGAAVIKKIEVNGDEYTGYTSLIYANSDKLITVYANLPSDLDVKYFLSYNKNNQEVILDNNYSGIFNLDALNKGRHLLNVSLKLGDKNIDSKQIEVFLLENYDASLQAVIHDINGYDELDGVKDGNTLFKMNVGFADGKKISLDDLENLSFRFTYNNISINDYKIFPEGGYQQEGYNSNVIDAVVFKTNFKTTGIYVVSATIGKNSSFNGYDDKIIHYYYGFSRNGYIGLDYNSANSGINLVYNNLNNYYEYNLNESFPILIQAYGELNKTFDLNETEKVNQANIEYAFYREDASGWVMIRDYLSTNSETIDGSLLSWQPFQSGIYNIQLRLRDSESKIFEKYTTIKVKVVDNNLLQNKASVSIKDLVNSKIITSSSNDIVLNIKAGNAYAINANYNLDDNAEVIYRYTLYSKNLSLIYLTSFSPDSQYIFVPEKPDQYILTIRVISAKSYGFTNQETSIIFNVGL